jgi:hypothetical protein
MKRFHFKKLIMVRIEGSRRSINYAHRVSSHSFYVSEKRTPKAKKQKIARFTTKLWYIRKNVTIF